jgi:mono/diheme cytochrome c family protein
MRKPVVLTVLMFLMLLAVSIVFMSSFDITITSSAQNANSSTSTNKNQNQNQNTRSIAPPSGAGGQQQDFSQNTWELPEDADKTKNPTAATPESIAKGKELYMERTKGNCIFCHAESGAGATRENMRRKPADLTNKERMTSMTDGEVFWKISKGITGIMPAGEKRMTEEERWHVVNYVRTLAKEKQ